MGPNSIKGMLCSCLLTVGGKWDLNLLDIVLTIWTKANRKVSRPGITSTLPHFQPKIVSNNKYIF